jgi:proteasome accessory factor B
VAEAKTERLLQLVLCLTQTRLFVTKEQLRSAIPDYGACATHEAFERMFERDKNELRELGVPLTTGGTDPLHDDDVGYRIDRGAYGMPDLHLTPDELTAVALAARVWRDGGLAAQAARVLVKLQAQGVDVDVATLPPIEPRISGGEAAFGPLARAVSRRQAVLFDYRPAGGGEAQPRRLEPWGVVSRRGHWYVVGRDRDRDDVRVFRLSRIDGAVRAHGAEGAFAVPGDADPGALVDTFEGHGPELVAVLRLRPGAGHGLRRRALPDEDDGLQRVPFRDGAAFAAEIASYGSAVEVLDPPELRDAVVDHLRRVCAAATEVP